MTGLHFLQPRYILFHRVHNEVNAFFYDMLVVLNVSLRGFTCLYVPLRIFTWLYVSLRASTHLYVAFPGFYACMYVLIISVESIDKIITRNCPGNYGQSCDESLS